jgi:hypothetical protein
MSKKELSQTARSICFDCYVKENSLVDISCSKCGKPLGVGSPDVLGKGNICRECWEPVKCPVCGYDNNGKLAKWMLAETDGVCRRCKEQGIKIQPENSVGQTAMQPEKDASYIERLLSWMW